MKGVKIELKFHQSYYVEDICFKFKFPVTLRLGYRNESKNGEELSGKLVDTAHEAQMFSLSYSILIKYVYNICRCLFSVYRQDLSFSIPIYAI